MMPQRASSCIFLQEFDERFLFHWKFSGGIINSVQNLKEDVMLEKIMDLHILLYAMAALGGLGAAGMLATHLTYRRLIRKNNIGT